MRPGPRVLKAFEFAFRAHEGAHRKGTQIPYIVHPMDVASTLMKNDAPEDVVVAGLLHDVVEDAGVSLADIEKEFGAEVARLVYGASEPEELRRATTREEKRRTWPERKSHTIEFITGADRHMKLLSCADKLSNISDMVRESADAGDGFWDKFNATRDQQAWYYRSMVDAFASGEGGIGDMAAFLEFKKRVEELFGQ